jgi:hypothetical protein
MPTFERYPPVGNCAVFNEAPGWVQIAFPDSWWEPMDETPDRLVLNRGLHLGGAHLYVEAIRVISPLDEPQVLAEGVVQQALDLLDPCYRETTHIRGHDYVVICTPVGL